MIVSSIALLFEFSVKRKVKINFTEQTVTNHEITDIVLSNPGKVDFLDRQSGKARFNGWGLNLDDKVMLNHWDAKVKLLNRPLSWLLFRAFDFHMVFTPDHVIIVPMANFASGCSSSISVFPRNFTNLEKEKQK